MFILYGARYLLDIRFPYFLHLKKNIKYYAVYCDEIERWECILYISHRLNISIIILLHRIIYDRLNL